MTKLNFTAGQLKSFIERVERLQAEMFDLRQDVKGVLTEAVGQGFDAKIIRKVVALRRKSKEARQEEEALIDLYMRSINGDSGTAAKEARPPTHTSEYWAQQVDPNG